MIDNTDVKNKIEMNINEIKFEDNMCKINHHLFISIYRGMEVDFDLKRVYSIPAIENLIF